MRNNAMLQTFTIVGLLVLLLLVITLVFCPSAQAQPSRPEIGGYPVVKQGDPTSWCSDLLCSGAGTARATGKVPAAPCDPWADDGIFNDQNPTDVACIRQRYGRPPGPNDHQLSWYGSWFAQHGSEGASMEREWAARFPGVVAGCLSRGNAAAARGYCDAYHTGGATLGCVLLSCGWTSCPSFPRTCPVAGGCGAGWRCVPLLELPESERPPAAAVRHYGGSAASDACSWHDGRGRTWIREHSPCFAGLPANCQTVASLRAECWAPLEPDLCGNGIEDPGECPSECPEDCAPATALLEIVGCQGGVWSLRLDGGAHPLDAPGEIWVGELAVRLPACPSECPAAGVLDAVRAVEGVCP